MIAQLTRKLFTVKEYYKLAEVGILKPTDRVELLNGEIITMSPIKSLHASITDYIFECLVSQLIGKAIIRSQNPISISNYSEPEPDLVIAHYQKHRYRNAHPTAAEIYLVIEVSDITLFKDRGVKKSLYAEAGISEYWIIDIPNQNIEVYKDLENGIYKTTTILRDKEVANFEKFSYSLAVDAIFLNPSNYSAHKFFSTRIFTDYTDYVIFF
jgi:Uma2 family endonuclease